MPTSFLALVRYVSFGVLMGAADVIPGVSGGTMALIVGIYERLVHAISTVVAGAVALVRFDLDTAWTKLWAVPWQLVLPLAAGIGAAIVAGAHVIPGLMAQHPQSMRGLFLGLVAASLFIPARRIERVTALRVAIGIAAAVGAFLLTGLPVLSVADPALPRVFFSAAVAICAMILPGVSGAFLLEALGVYTPTLNAITQLDWAYVATFAVGAAGGLAAFSTLLDRLLRHRHDATMAALVGLIAGALRALWPYGGASRTLALPGPEDPVVPVVLLALAGFGVVFLLLFATQRTAARGPAAT